ncbi:methyltransferase domain-containing protein [Nocardioides sp. Kera G14]|uniref:methyltransferase domain-containing protein n=1 Tax=Nocardioides sp. Kera G14 TaxID=2884264 RepID=UPI001D0F8BA8|nr:methyltransferase domain-containing protein [Nocardioides sp. Kera G14]UDY23616.1 class I SAM-dependent methyltransferase [Nocardioides sp. Kera G14]
MTEPGATTFAHLLRGHLESGTIGRDDSVLVQFAGIFDEQVCAAVGLRNCEFVNIAPDSPSSDIGGTAVDAHKMPYASGSYDHVIGHSGLHHCSRPHEALHEMYRIASKTVLFVENQDSVAMRWATRAGVVSWHELPAVEAADFESGGVDGTGVPNFVYRWTRRDLQKAVASFDPAYDVPIEIHTEWNLGRERIASRVLQQRLGMSDEKATRLFERGQKVLNAVAGRQGNIFAATIRKDLARLHPWMATPTEMRR